MLHIPPPNELAYLIRCPKPWAQLLEQAEQTKSTLALIAALQDLPESSVRDARIARILRYHGQTEEAKIILNKHRTCPLCKAMYFALLVSEGDEDTMRQIVNTWRPDWKTGAELIEFEALYRSYVALASAATRIKRASPRPEGGTGNSAVQCYDENRSMMKSYANNNLNDFTALPFTITPDEMAEISDMTPVQVTGLIIQRKIPAAVRTSEYPAVLKLIQQLRGSGKTLKASSLVAQGSL